MNNFTYLHTSDIAVAHDELNRDAATVPVAGGTNLVDLWRYGLTDFKRLIHIRELADAQDITELEHGGVMLGALVNNAATAYHPLIQERYPLLSQAILAGASPQIRNMATNGGNLLQRTRCAYFYDRDLPCNKRQPGSGCPAIEGHNRMHAILGQSEDCIAVFPSDMCVALAALNAKVHVSGPDGSRFIPFETFHRLPGSQPERDNTLGHAEIITGIELPPEGFSQQFAYLKLRDRSSYAFALVSVALGFTLKEGRIESAGIALGGVAHKPWQVPEAVEAMKGKAPVADTFHQIADLLLAGAKGYRYNHFKIEMARRAIVRCAALAMDPWNRKPGAGPD